MAYLAVKSPNFFLEDIWFLAKNISILILIFFYMLWLIGATIDNWRMPIFIHLVPIIFLSLTIWRHGAAREDFSVIYKNAIPPSTKAVRAMLRIKQTLGKIDACDKVTTTRLIQVLGDFRYSGYRSHGIMKDFNFFIREGEEKFEDVSALSNIPPGSIFFVCDNDSKKFWMTAVVSASIPQGVTTFVVDDLGNIFYVQGFLEK